MDNDYTLSDWNSADGASTSEGFIRPLLASSYVSLALLEIAPGEEVIPHKHQGLPYFEVILCIVEGQLEVIAGSKRITTDPGICIMVDPDDSGWINRTNKTVKALIIHAPPPAWKSAQEFRERLMGRPGTRE
jgi:mannose-6-phosphate isomerase-like protein (cupin superfamily)